MTSYFLPHAKLKAKLSLFSTILAGCWASDDDSMDEEAATSIGMPRATLLSAISGIAGIPGIAAPSVYQVCPLGGLTHERSYSQATNR